MKENIYTVWLTCGNCGRIELHVIPKGTRIEDYLMETDCLYCGCKMKENLPSIGEKHGK